MKLEDLKVNPLKDNEAEWLLTQVPKLAWIPFAKDGTHMAVIFKGKRYLISIAQYKKKADAPKPETVASKPKRRPRIEVADISD